MSVRRGLVELAREWSLVAVSVLARYRIGVGSYVRIRAFGIERLPPAPFLLCSNHASHIDYVALVEALGIAHGEIIAIAAEDFHFDASKRSRIVRRMFNLAPIERGGSLESVRQCVDTCRDFIERGGKVVVVYPEGTRSNDGRIGQFKHGFAIIAWMLGLPLVPASIDGSFGLYSRHHFIPRCGTISVRFGSAIPIAERSGRPNSQQARELTNQVEQAVRALSAEAAKSLD